MPLVVPSNVSFDRVFNRMTSAECLAALQNYELISGGSAPANRSAEYALTYWHWNAGDGTYYSTNPYRYAGGLYPSNQNAYQIRQSLKALFEADRSGFVAAAAGSGPRAAELFVEEPKGIPAALSARRVWCWNATLTADFKVRQPGADPRAMMAQPILTFAAADGSLPNIANLAAALAAQPAGRRVLSMGGFRPLWAKPITSGAASGRFAVYEMEHTTASRVGISLAAWATYMADVNSNWKQFWSQLGASPNDGNGKPLVDRLMIDTEFLRRFWMSQAGSGGDSRLYGDTFDNIFTDSYWETFRSTLIKPVLSQTVWNGYTDWDIANDHRCLCYDQWAMDYWCAQWAGPLAVPITYFPGLIIGDYDRGQACSATRGVHASPTYQSNPIGGGGFVGNRNSVSFYGLHIQINGSAQITVPRYNWAIPGTDHAVLSGRRLAYALLAQAVAQSKASAGVSTSVPLEMWLAWSKLKLGALSNPFADDPLYDEFILHLSLLSGESDVMFYNSDNDTPPPSIQLQDQARFLAMIAERDDVVGFGNAILDLGEPLDTLEPAYVATRVWAGYRWIYRITPNPNGTRVVDEADRVVVFDARGERVLTIPRARITKIDNSPSTAGYWVQRAPSRRLAREWAVSLGTTPTRIIPCVAKPFASKVVLIADHRNTQPIYIGASIGMTNAVAANTTCGYPLAAGQRFSIELSRNELDDESSIYAASGSGTQSLVCQVS